MTWCARENSGWQMLVFILKLPDIAYRLGDQHGCDEVASEEKISNAVRVATIMGHAPERMKATR